MVQMVWLVLLFVSQVLGINVQPLAEMLSSIFQMAGLE